MFSDENKLRTMNVDGLGIDDMFDCAPEHRATYGLLPAILEDMNNVAADKISLTVGKKINDRSDIIFETGKWKMICTIGCEDFNDLKIIEVSIYTLSEGDRWIEIVGQTLNWLVRESVIKCLLDKALMDHKALKLDFLTSSEISEIYTTIPGTNRAMKTSEEVKTPLSAYVNKGVRLVLLRDAIGRTEIRIPDGVSRDDVKNGFPSIVMNYMHVVGGWSFY